MKLNKIAIKNYRQFHNTDICLDNIISILAGPNNSGKTSLVELCRNLFEQNFYSINYSDINVHSYYKNKLEKKHADSVQKADRPSNYLFPLV